MGLLGSPVGELWGSGGELVGPYGLPPQCARAPVSRLTLIFLLQLEFNGGVGGSWGELVRPYGCPLHVRTRARLNTYSCLVFLLQCSKAGGAGQLRKVW